MAKDTTGVVVGANGTPWVAPKGTTAPIDPVIAPAAAWIDLGYLTDDGTKVTKNRQIVGIPAWQSFYDLRKIVQSEKLGFAFSVLQWGKDQIKLAFGGGTVTTVTGPPLHYKYQPPAPGLVDERAFMLDWVDGTYAFRLIVPRVMVTEAVESTVGRKDAAKLPIGIEVLGTDGVDAWYLLTTHPAFA